MKTKNIIFHHPLPLVKSATSASSIRPLLLLDAFKKLGYKVFPVTGYSQERAHAIAEVKEFSSQGNKFDFLYSELTTSPLPTNDPHNLPLHPFLDFSFFRWFQKQHGKVGVFYRDAHWRFPFYGANLNFIKRKSALALYQFEAQQLAKSVDNLFIPSSAMKTYLPKKLQALPVTTCPPGTIDSPHLKQEQSKKKLLYAGGITPPIYDLTELLDVIKATPHLSLTLCTRQEEWSKLSRQQRIPLSPNIQVIFKDFEQLKAEFLTHDFFVMPIKRNPYFDMAMPMKLFDAISFNLPIFATKGTQAAHFVDSENIGWSIDNCQEVVDIISQTTDQDLQTISQNLEKVRQQNTWEARVKLIAQTLTS